VEQFAAEHPGWATMVVVAAFCVPLLWFMMRKDEPDQTEDSQTF